MSLNSFRAAPTLGALSCTTDIFLVEIPNLSAACSIQAAIFPGVCCVLNGPHSAEGTVRAGQHPGHVSTLTSRPRAHRLEPNSP